MESEQATRQKFQDRLDQARLEAEHAQRAGAPLEIQMMRWRRVESIERQLAELAQENAR